MSIYAHQYNAETGAVTINTEALVCTKPELECPGCGSEAYFLIKVPGHGYICDFCAGLRTNED